MRNKKLTYILIPVVILLWGYIFYKIFWGARNTNEYVNYRQIKADTLTIKPEEFEYDLLVNYTDPFLKNRTVKRDAIKKQNEQTNQSRRVNTRRRRTQATRWPNIKYGGIITNESSEKITILVEIDNSKCLMNIGEERKGVIIMHYYPDSIIVKYKEEEKTILK